MWLHLALLLIVGAAWADHDHAWETGNEYHYHVHSRTLTNLEEVTKEYSGILIKGTLIVQATSPDNLQAEITKPRYARVHRELPDGWASRIPMETLEPLELPMSGKPFRIKLKHGVIRDLLVEKDVPTWEVNVLKSIASQLQVDTQGENRIRSSGTQVPDDEHPFAMFRAMEDSVSGKCEVLYDVTPMSESVLHDRPELVPLPQLLHDGERHFDIMKTKNYTRCEQRMGYHFGIVDHKKWSPISRNGYVSRSSVSRVVISGNLKRFTIQSSVTVDKISVSQKTYTGMVYGGINVTLDKVDKVSKPLAVSDDLVSTGNLVYTYNSPFSRNEKHEKTSPSIARNSLPVPSSETSESSSEEMLHVKRKDSQDSSSGSSESSISIANSDERSYLHSKPSLDEAPDTPLLSYFVGYGGKTIGNSEKVNTVEVAVKLIKKLPDEIAFTQLRSLSLGLLETFTILTRLVRTMDTKEIAELQEKTAAIANEISDDLDEELKEYYLQNYWDVLRDAVTQAGTGPALKTIVNWIKSKKLVDTEAARVVSRLPMTVRVPTAEYIQAFFEMITEPEVMHERSLNVSAPIAFAKLVHQAQVSMDRYNRYPIFAFGRMVPKHDQALFDTYIPYMAKQLQEAIKDGDSTRIQTYIMALGSFAHPKILSIFEPYLEGTVPVSDYQRLLIVMSLSKLIPTNPRLTRSVAYKIYLNIRETDEIRATAAFIVLATNPSLTTWQRMAEFTNRDDSKYVNSAIRSFIEGFVEMEESSELQDIVAKARIVEPLLRPGNKDDKNYVYAVHKIFALKNVFYRMAMLIFGSDDSDLPKAELISVYASWGAFNLPSVSMGYMVSSMKQLLNIWETLENDDDDEQKSSAVEKIVRELGIQPEDPQQLEGNLFLQSIYGMHFHPFDNHTIERFVDALTKNFVKAMEPGLFQFKNINHLMSYDITMGFPTETGLPFVYNLEVPRLLRISGEGKFNMKPLQAFTTNLNVAGHLIFADSIQNRIGFVAPFEHHEYIAGIDKNVQLFLPIGLEVKFEPAHSSIQLKIHPDNYYRYGLDMITLTLSNIPFTSSYDILKLEPVLLDNGTQIAYRRKSYDEEFSFNDNIHVFMSSDAIDDSNMAMYRARAKMWTEFQEDDVHFKMLNVMLKSLPGQVNVTFNVVETDADSTEDHEASDWPDLPPMADKNPNSEARRQQFLKQVSEGVNSATNYIVDVDAYLPTILRNRQILTIGISESNVDEKSRGMVYWRPEVRPGGEREEKMQGEICAAGLMRWSQDILLDAKKAIDRVPKDEINAELQLGRTCEDGVKIRISANQTRSEDFKEMIVDSDVAEKCQREMKEGNMGLHACQKAIAMANMRNHAIMSIDFGSEIANEVANEIVQFASWKFSSDNVVKIANMGNARNDTIELELKLLPDLEDIEFAVHTSAADITFYLTDLYDTTLSSLEDEIIDLFDEDDIEASCTVDKTKAVTFDNRTYPLKLGQCWHVMTTTYAQKNPDHPHELLPIPDEMQVAVLVKETDDGHKQVRMLMGDKQIEMQKSGEHLEATVNGEKIQFSRHKSHRIQEDDETVIEIFALPDGSIRVLSDEYEVNAVYDGERVRVQLSDEYRNEVRGLCGNYDGESDNDFTTPKNCLLRKPEEFAATYAMTGEPSCEGPAVANRQIAEQSKCIRITHRQSNVISDREAGRSWTEDKNWGYHHEHRDPQAKRCTLYRTKIVQEGEKICFTTRPLPICADGCKPTEIKTKKYSLHCMPMNAPAIHLKKRIEHGANPDMTQRRVSMSHSYEVPLSCNAV